MECPRSDDPTYSPSGASNHGVVAARPLSDTEYDVFVSFRGFDIRDNLLSHLTEAFERKTIEYFVDDQLKEGDDVWPSLVKAIEGSFISLVIFSEDYACSNWCLKELAKILECSQKYRQTVIPVFYKVQPTFVRHQNNESYIKVFEDLEKNHSLTLVQSWRVDMENAANKSGIVSTNFRTDADVVKKIIEAVYSTLWESSKHLVDSNGLVGFENHFSRIKEFVRGESKPVHVIGIWGKGGIGKTTIAGEVFNQLRPNNYRSGCFLPDLKNEFKEESKYNKKIISLKEKLCNRLLDKDVKIDSPNGLPTPIKRMIGRSKALIVLDDVNDSSLLNNIFGSTLDWLKSGSTIILTSRNKQVLIANGVDDDDVYQVEEMSSTEALQLFKLKAFSQNILDSVDYDQLSIRVVKYAGGIPLVLKVLGLLLRKKDKKFWTGQLDKLDKMPIEEVYGKMKLSYEDLDPQEKRIFLDLACILCECNLEVDYIKDMLKDNEKDDELRVGLVSLEDKALITISEDEISMHDIIKEMGREIVRRESIEHPENRSHLWDDDDICKVLESNQGTKAIRSILFFPGRREMKLSRQTFANMTKLRFLVLDSYPIPKWLDLHEGPISFPSELRYLSWIEYPQEYLPENFSAESLVILDLSFSKVKKLWHGVQNLVNLKSVDLRCCPYLENLPSFLKAMNLEVLNASDCERLTEVHPSILSLKKLQTLKLGNCISLSSLVSSVHMSSLRTLHLGNCEQLREFSVTSENMVELDLQYTRVNALPSSFGCQSMLEYLNLRGCEIESLPSSITNLTRLRYLNLICCEKLRTISDLPPSLETLLVVEPQDKHSLETVSFPSKRIKSMTRVEFWNCLKLDEASRVAIGLVAQDCIKKFACQHLSNCAGNNFDGYDEYNYDYYWAKYAYPGSNVPNWFSYKATEDHIIIDLSSSSGTRSAPLGFIFCFVVYSGEIFVYDGDKEVAFDVTISDCEGKGTSESAIMSICSSVVIMGSYHVCVMYDKRISCYLNSKAKDLNKFQIQAKLLYEQPINKSILRCFGICPISPETFDN